MLIYWRIPFGNPPLVAYGSVVHKRFDDLSTWGCGEQEKQPKLPRWGPLHHCWANPTMILLGIYICQILYSIILKLYIYNYIYMHMYIDIDTHTYPIMSEYRLLAPSSPQSFACRPGRIPICRIPTWAKPRDLAE